MPEETAKRRTRLEWLWDEPIHSDLYGAFFVCPIALYRIGSPAPPCSGKDFLCITTPMKAESGSSPSAKVQLAEKLNISLDHLRKIEGGQRGCSVDLLVVLSDTFGVSMDFLVLGRGRTAAETKDRLQSLIDGLAALKESL